MDEPKIVSPLLEACEVLGGKRRLAQAVGVSPAAVTRWQKSGIPHDRVLDIERVSRISRHRLRPDIYGELVPPPQEGERHEG